MIEINNVMKSFGQTQVLKNVNFKMNAGEQCVIQGASGSGKSTLLYLIGGLDIPSKGDISVAGVNLNQLSDEQLASYRNTTVGFVFQFHFLLPSMNCINNILLPSRIAGGSIKKSKELALNLAEELSVSHCLKKYPFEISGGEQQRINLIRAVSLRPKLLLCDEPTGNLDSQNTEKVALLLKAISREFKTTLLVVTHDEEVAMHFDSRHHIHDGILYLHAPGRHPVP